MKKLEDYVITIPDFPEEGIMYIGSKYRDVGRWRTFDKGVEVYD